MGTELEEMVRVVGRSGRSPDFDDNIDNAGGDGDDDGELCWGRSPIWPSADCEGSEAKFCGWLDLSGSCEIQNIGCWLIRLFIWRPLLRLAWSMAQSGKRDPLGPSRGWTLPIINQFDKLWKWQLSRLCIYCLFFFISSYFIPFLSSQVSLNFLHVRLFNGFQYILFSGVCTSLYPFTVLMGYWILDTRREII